MSTPQDILDFWFAPDMTPKWFDKDDAVDAVIRGRFLPVVKQALRGAYEEWAATPETRLALIIVLDQFSRNIFRGDSRSFSGDARALALTRESVALGQDAMLEGTRKTFFYMPLMHSENLADQDLGIALFDTAGLGDNAHYARLHRDIQSVSASQCSAWAYQHGRRNRFS